MDLPVIETPVAPRWVWMEEVTYSHIPIATIVTAFLVMAPIIELIGYRRKDPRYDRLAKGFVYFSMILFSPGAALGTGIPMFIIGLYPEFWSRWANLFFGPLIVQFIFFLCDVFFLFFLYYLLWDKMMNRKPLHILFGFITATFGLLIQAIWDATGAYMMTPSVPFPAVNEPVGFSMAALLNPSFPFLFSHRFFGNISYVMLLTGGIYALKYMRAKEKKQKDYWGFASNLTFSLGFLAFFAMPFIGWGYAKILQQHAPVAFHAIMGGHTSIQFIVKLTTIAIFLNIGGVYVFVRYRQKRSFLIVVTLLLASVYLVLTLHPAVDWLGSAAAWRIGYTVVLGGMIAFFWLMSRTNRQITDRRWPWALFVAGLASVIAFGMGGFVRERAKSPYTVYDEKVKPEVLPFEADRYLLYDKCMGCHDRFKSPKDILGMEGVDWKARIKRERERPGVELTDQEAERLIRYLEENTR